MQLPVWLLVPSSCTTGQCRLSQRDRDSDSVRAPFGPSAYVSSIFFLKLFSGYLRCAFSRQTFRFLNNGCINPASVCRVSSFDQKISHSRADL